MPNPIVAPTAGSGLGEIPWESYYTGAVSGVGSYGVNVTNRNLLISSQDFATATGYGVTTSLTREYNSLSSTHNVNNDDHTYPAIFGNGWTNEFDQRIANDGAGGYVVFDATGHGHHFAATTNTAFPLYYNSTTPGDHTVLTTQDGGSFGWYKPDGSSVWFWAPAYANGPDAAMSGRISIIFARNHHAGLYFAYGFSCSGGSVSATSASYLSSISVQATGGLTTTFTLSQVGANQLVTSVTRPDGQVIKYTYDVGGNLTTVSLPGNGSNATEIQSYSPVGNFLVVISPRCNAAGTSNLCGLGGGYTAFGLSAAPFGNASGIQLVGSVNFTPTDGTNTALNQSLPTGGMQYNWTPIGANSQQTVFADTDGHNVYYNYDSLGRTTSVVQTAVTPNQTTLYGWSTDNQLISAVDPRGTATGNLAGYETDMEYDSVGNLIAIAEPSESTSAGTMRPTTLISYDQFHNIVSECEPAAVNALGLNWSSPPQISDNVCPQSVSATRFSYQYASYEPYGELVTEISPGTPAATQGYARSIAYAVAAQNGVDYGLPTAVTATSAILQNDGTARAPSALLTYDNLGRVLTMNNGVGTTRVTHDTLGNVTATNDPDGVVSAATYNLDGTLASTQSAAQIAAGTRVQYAYDADKNLISKTFPNNSTVSSTFKYWYDAAERLVEVQQPSDPSDYYSYPWLNRYLYDLTGGGNPPTYRGTSVKSFGNLFKTQIFVGTQTSVAKNTSAWTSTGWTDISATAYDALNRPTSSYKVIPATNSPNVTFASDTARYDEGNAVGLLTSTTSKTGDVDVLSYDNNGNLIKDVSTNAATGTLAYTYDPDGLLYDLKSSVFGDDITSYDLDGHLKFRKEPTGGGVSDPITLSYGYYPDGLRSSVTVVGETGTVSGFSSTSPTKSYSYRNDNALTNESLNYNNESYAFSWTFSPAGRTLTRNDPFASPAYSYAYDSYGRLHSKTMPNVAYTSLVYDAQDEPTGFNAYGTSVTNTYSTRGELLGEAYGSDACTGSSSTAPFGTSLPAQWHNSKSANGFLFPQVVCNASLGSPTFTEWDHNLGTITVSGSYQAGTGLTDSGTQYLYDNAGRMSGTNTQQVFSRGGPSVVCTNLSGRSYDSQNHLTEISYKNQASHDGLSCYTYYLGTNIYQWGPNKRIIRIGFAGTSGSASPTPPPLSSATYVTAHWDGDSLLFNSQPDGKVRNVNFDGLAEDYPSGIGYSQFSPWNIAGRYTFWVYDYNLAGGIDDARVSTTPHATYNANTPAAVMDGYVEGPVNAGGYGLDPVSRDSLSDNVITVSGVRTLEPGTTQWNTPDDANPSSSNAYVWDNNNPYMFRDPTGYAAFGSTTGADNPDGMGGLGNGSIGGEPLDPTELEPLRIDSEQRNQLPRTAPGMTSWQERDADAVMEQLEAQNAGFKTVDEWKAAIAARQRVGPGPFAGESIPARSSGRNFTDAERAAINSIGKSTGCHTCGATESGTLRGNFIPDHQPVTKLSLPGIPQILMPQCLACSNSQGGLVNAILKRGRLF